MRKTIGIIFALLTLCSLFTAIQILMKGDAPNQSHGLNVSYYVGTFLPFIVCLIITVYCLQSKKKKIQEQSKTIKEKPNFFQQAARASYISPVIVLFLSSMFFFVRAQHVRIGFGIVNSLLLFGGFVMGILALLGIKKYGRKAILIPAIIGLTINTFFISFGAYSFSVTKKMKEKAMKRQKDEFELSQKFVSIVEGPEKTFLKSLGAFTQKPLDKNAKTQLKDNLTVLKQQIEELNTEAVNKQYELQNVTRCYSQAVKSWGQGIKLLGLENPNVLKAQKEFEQGDAFKQQAVDLYNRQYVKASK